MSRLFTEIAPGLGLGEPLPVGWRPLATRPLLILVGVTGVGKSTILAALRAAGADFHLLPDRRLLTDQLIIAEMQAADGLPIRPVGDRAERFDHTRRYRERYPGGMAHALAQLWVGPTCHDSPLLFDGLRGENEVRHAAEALPRTRFVALDAPDAVRVQRLLGRGDAFDQVSGQSRSNSLPERSLRSFADLGVSGAETLFSRDEEERLLSLVWRGEVTPDDLQAKLRIVIAERQNYDPAAAIAALQALAGERTLVVDTTVHTPGETARLIMDKLVR